MRSGQPMASGSTRTKCLRFTTSLLRSRRTSIHSVLNLRKSHALNEGVSNSDSNTVCKVSRKHCWMDEKPFISDTSLMYTPVWQVSCRIHILTLRTMKKLSGKFIEVEKSS